MLQEQWGGNGTLKTQGGEAWNANHTWVNKETGKPELNDSLSFDITDYFLSFQGTDRQQMRELLGDRNKISDQTFSQLHSSYIKSAIIKQAQQYVQFFGADEQKKNENFDDSVLNNEWQKLYSTFGLESLETGDVYNTRLYVELAKKHEYLKEKINAAENWEAEWQTELSSNLRWGYLDQADYEHMPEGRKISSLCYAASLLEAHDLNMMKDTSLAKKVDFLEDMRKISVPYWEGDVRHEGHLVEADGYVRDPILLIQKYAKETKTGKPIQLNNWQRLGVDPSSNYAEFGTSLFRENGIVKHFVTNRYLDMTAPDPYKWIQPFRNPYPNGEVHPYNPN